MNPQAIRLKALLAGTGALLISAASSSAAITWSGVLDIPIPTNFAGVYLDLAVVGGAPVEPSGPDIVAPDSYTVGYHAPAGWDVNFFFGGIGIAYSDTFQPFIDDNTDNLSQVLNAAPGTTIDMTSATARTLGIANFGGSGQSNGSTVGESHFGAPDLVSPAYAAFTPGQPGNIAFVVLNPGDSTPVYGWMRVTLADDGTPGVIHEWAYSETSIAVGAIPEPGSVALLLAGAACLLRRRR